MQGAKSRWIRPADAVILTLCLLVGQGCALYDVRGQIRNAVYTSPEGRFRAKVPPLVRPGARIEDGTPGAGGFFVSFRDDLCRVYMITEQTILEDQSLESWIDQRVLRPLQEVHAQLRERRTVETRWGAAVFIRYREPQGGRCVTRWVTSPRDETPPVAEDMPDAEVAMYALRSGQYVYRIVYGAAEGVASNGTFFGAQTLPVEENLNRFLEGFELLRRPEK
jgi:hypothetical protein